MEIRVEFTGDILRSDRHWEGMIPVSDNFREMSKEDQEYYIYKEWKDWAMEQVYGIHREVDLEDEDQPNP